MDCPNKALSRLNPRIEQKARARDNPWIACSKHAVSWTIHGLS